MVVLCDLITLHPQAKDLLFKHYRTLSRIFNDVLGHLEIDYIGIALLNSKNELFFLSSRPSVECNLIEKDLWSLDSSLQKEFFARGTAQLWETLYQEERQKSLYYYRKESQNFSMGISVPATFEEYQIVYSFALKSNNEIIKNKIVQKIETLISMGRFCLQNIIKTITLPDRQIRTTPKPTLKLIINKKVLCEDTT
ncbi:MAG: flagellar biosynthesis protein FlgJ [Tatlockia sp.]|nr:flagellar biosynthesis protein FlgJ [Tatlockia sp.]